MTMSRSASTDVVVIGAGPAGLAASACLRREGVAHVVLEREATVGSTWRRHYDRLHLHTTKTFSALPMTPWPRDAPRYPSRDQFVQYLQSYATTHDVAPRFGVNVRAVKRVDGRLVVDTDDGTITARAVIVATGCNRVPRWPAFPGLDEFGGVVMHAIGYRNPGPFRGLRTLVVGCGNSGAEIALDLAEHGVDVAMVVRGPVHVVPRDLWGRPTQHTNIALSRLPLALRDAIAGLALRLAVGDLSRWGIVRPSLGPNRMIEMHGRVPMLDVGTLAMVRQGRIRVLPAVEEVFPGQVRIAGGATRPFDAIVLATGYDNGLEGLVDNFAAITDARGRPHRLGEETGVPGLYFIGFRNPATGALREIAIEAPRVARSIRTSFERSGGPVAGL